MLFCSVYHSFNAPRHRDTASGNAHWRSAVNRHTVIYMHKNTEEDMHHFCMYFCSFMHPCTEWNILYMYKQRLALKLCRQEIYSYVWMPFHINAFTCWYLFIIFFIVNNDNLLFIYVGQRSGPLVCRLIASLCLRGFSSGTPAFSNSPKTYIWGNDEEEWIGNSKLSIAVCERECEWFFVFVCIAMNCRLVLGATLPLPYYS